MQNANYIYEIRERDAETVVAVTGQAILSAFAEIPPEIDGLPTRIIAANAFAGRQDLKEIALPDSIDTLERFAFHNCRALRKITATDNVTEYQDGVIRQCASLRFLVVDARRGDFTLVSRALADSDNTLTFDLTLPDGRALLTFPGFVYDFTENTMARTIQFNIEGSGMAFRECVSKRGIDYAEYDRLFERAMLDEISIITEVAFGRLMRPYALSDGAKASYENYLRAHAPHILKELIDARDVAKLTFFAAGDLIPQDALADALARAADVNDPALTAALMNRAARASRAQTSLTL